MAAIALVAADRRKYCAVMNAKVIVMPKAAVLDPQGNAVRDAMRHLGMPEVRSVRIGKYMEIDIEGQNGELESRLHQLCRDLLSNPVIEDYELLTGSNQESRKKRRQTRSRRSRGRVWNESAAIFFLCGFSAARRADDRAHREFLPQHYFDVARLDSGSHSRVSRRERLSCGATRSRRRTLTP